MGWLHVKLWRCQADGVGLVQGQAALELLPTQGQGLLQAIMTLPEILAEFQGMQDKPVLV